MSLRVRIRWLLAISAACCVALATVALYWVNLSLVETLTERNAERELEKVEASFLDQLSILRVRAQDWSRQPDNPPTNQGGLGYLDLMMELRGSSVVWNNGADQVVSPVFATLAKRFDEQGCMPIWGVVKVEGRPLLFSTAVEVGCQAYLLGVWLDSDWMSYLSDRVGHALYVREVPGSLKPQRGLTVAEGDQLLGRFPVPDFLGGNPLEVVVELPRDGYQSLNLSVLVIGVIIAVLAGLTVMVINYRIQPMLFGRLNLVHNAVRSIARGGALDQRVPVLGNDEIGALAEDFNAMVDSINHAQTQLADARRQAEEASQTKSQFLANISHEIRTPMTAILGYTELLRDGSLSQADQNRYLTIIQQNGDALLALINDVLDLSRIEAGQLHNEQRLFSVTELLDEVVDSLQLRAQEKQIDLGLNYLSAMPMTVCGDAFRLRQILVNLVGNAVKFTEEGQVQVRASWSEVEQQLQVSVEDSGIGISDAEQQKIFQPFSQADASHSRRYTGTGLGLSIARQLARSQGGDISVFSELNKGSHFSLAMPLSQATEVDMRDAAAQQLPELAGTAMELKGRVLLVEDNAVNRLFVRKVLEKSGMQVVEAEDGREACRYYTEDSFDLVVLDMQMPVMDGYETAQALRDRGFAGPILALTANVLAVDRQRCMDAGCNAFLGKPIRVKQLITVCAGLLAQPEIPEGVAT
ncbi:ATP-binding protein [Alcanivorax sp. IL2]|uniref:ATP-binding protein n=1 Tax=Alcanivorax sp. IL2 TaxID=3396310 RepID=UPI0039C28776